MTNYPSEPVIIGFAVAVPEEEKTIGHCQTHCGRPARAVYYGDLEMNVIARNLLPNDHDLVFACPTCGLVWRVFPQGKSPGIEKPPSSPLE